MKPYVITISRQFASMGRSISLEISKELGIEFYDRDLVEEVAQRMQLSISLISKEEETAGHIYFNRQFPLGIGVPSLQDEVYSVQKSIIEDLAKKESCVIVGRLADQILKDYPNHLSVFIYASYEERLKNCVEKLKMPEETAKKMMVDVDAARARYRKKYAPEDKGIFASQQLMIDSGYFGVEGSAKLIAQIIKERFAD